MTTPYALIRYDTEKEEPVKNSKGFCIEVPRGGLVSHLPPQYMAVFLLSFEL